MNTTTFAARLDRRGGLVDQAQSSPAPSADRFRPRKEIS
jgi:hypothetical protein